MASATTTLSVKPFDGTGYENWDFRIKLLLEHCEVFEMCSKRIPPAATENAVFLKKGRQS